MSAPFLPRNTVVVGDVHASLKRLPRASVDCVITSPPYYQLRDYGVEGQIGLEDHVDAWVDELRLAMRGLARVLKPTASCWLNLGDSYARHARYGAPAKSLLLGPERLLLALVGDGWTIRNKIVWAKPNPMPTSVRDRLNTTWEPVYLLTRSKDYFFDLAAIRVPHRSLRHGPPKSAQPTAPTGRPSWAGPLAGSNSGLDHLKASGLVGHPLGANPGDVWSVATAGYRGQHFATFPTRLIERPLLASCPERVCGTCGRPWEREPVSALGQLATLGELRPSCECAAGWRPGLVLDPFFGAGTVGLVAEKHNRDWLGIELNPRFARLAEERIAQAGMVEREGGKRRVA